METIIKKIEALYADMTAKMLDLKNQQSEYNKWGADLLAMEDRLNEWEAQLNIDQERILGITDMLDVQNRAKEMIKKAEQDRADLNKAQNAFEEWRAVESKKIADLHKEANETHAETKATRERLMVEVKRVAEEKENLRKTIINELVAKL